MLDALKGYIASKKWLAIIVMAVIATLAQLGVIGAEGAHTLELILGLGVAGQAVTDHGKSAAEIQATGIATSPGVRDKQSGRISDDVLIGMTVMGIGVVALVLALSAAGCR